MNVSDQGVREAGGARHHVLARTLVFVTRSGPQGGEREVLLLRGAPGKRLWPDRYNGLGGHVEANEDVLSAARREVREEAGFEPGDLELRGIINIDTGSDEHGARPGVLVFVFRAEVKSRLELQTAEGSTVWIAVDALANLPLVDDLHELLPRTLSNGPLFYGHYFPRPDGALQYEFSP